MGLAPPKKVLDATAEYRQEMDIIGRFILDETVQSPGVNTPLTDMYSAYAGYVQQAGEGQLYSKTKFNKKLRSQQHKLISSHTKRGGVWDNISLRNEKKSNGPLGLT